MKFSEYPGISKFTDDQIMLVDGTAGTKKIPAKTAVLAALELNNVINHRNVFRGKNLGSSFTEAQKAAIRNGTFDDLWVGDYWVIGGVTWRIVDFDYWYNTGDTKFVKHHAVIMPDTALYDAAMNSAATTTGGYGVSAMRSTNLNTAKSTINNAFGASYVLSHREYLTNAVSGNAASGGTWYDSTVEIPNEIMLYGCHIQAAMGGHMSTTCKTQLALFRLAPEFISIAKIYWLRDIASYTEFCRVYSTGIAQKYSANASVGVRPVFAIG